MMRHVIRIELAWLRCPLLLVAWPWSVLKAAAAALAGGHGWVLLTSSFYRATLDVFTAAWRGEFIPK